jgi:hypothetical protein
VGATCDGTEKKYTGGMWHDVSIVNPDASTLMYACVNDGCPDEGSSTMRCKEGYGGPLCAVCDEGYFVQVRKCIECKEPHWGAFFPFCVGLVALALVVARYLRQYKRYLDITQTFSHFKIFVSWVTVMSTVTTQFGVVWPASFARALDGLSVLSFDFGVLAGVFCMANIDYYQSLLLSTLFLVGIICVILSTPGISVKKCVFAAVYTALFAYPVCSVKIVQMFACHEIVYMNDVSITPAAANISATATRTFLRADYSLECGTPKWTAYAVYAGLWIVLYVVAFPVYVFHQLLTCYYRTQHQDQHALHTSLGSTFDSSLFHSMESAVSHESGESHLESVMDDSMGSDLPALAPPKRKGGGSAIGQPSRTKGCSRLGKWGGWVVAGVVRRISGSSDLQQEPMLAFLADDYRPGMPMMLWEAQEMVRLHPRGQA